jgi:hypothetical protein
MNFSASCRSTTVFVPVALAISALAGAQTLQHRPLTRPPAAPAAATTTAAQPQQSPVLPKGTSLQVEITRHYPMKAGEAIEGHLLFPIYANGKLVVPKDTLLRGQVVALNPDNKARWSGRVRGDFTPYHTAVVRFDQLVLPDGPVPIAAATATDGAPVLQLSTPGATAHKSFISREWSSAKSRMHDQVAFFTDPGRGDRALQLLYRQLPYHPQRIAAHTAWSFELKAPLTLPDSPSAPTAQPQPAPPTSKTEVWNVNAILTRTVTSAQAHPGDPVQALVVEPVYDRGKQLVIPQGSTLVGKVTAAKAARSFGRNGKLRFTFQQVRFPAGFGRPVEGSLAGAATEKTQDLQLDAEGTISPRNRASAIAPILLTMLAGRALDQDGNLTVHTGVASNGFGFIGRIVGVAAGSRNLAAGIGFYAAGLSFFDNFLHSGRDVVFPKDTRIEIETNPLRAPVLRPTGQ